MVAAVQSNQRYTVNHPCPVCGGFDQAERGKGVRCFGFDSFDGKFAHCTNESYAGSLEPDSADSYLHALDRPCKCGQNHAIFPLDNGNSLCDTQGVGASREVRLEAQQLDWANPDYKHVYQDSEGAALFAVMRWDTDNGKVIRQTEKKNGVYTKNIQGVPRPFPLYRLPSLLKAHHEEFVYVVEGEKCVDTLVEYDLVATTTMGGAGKSHNSDLTPLLNKRVVLIPDQDKVGRDHMNSIRTSLLAMGCREVRYVELPTIREKADVVDYLNEGGTIEGIESLANAAVVEGRAANMVSPSLTGVDFEWEPYIEFGTFDLPNFPLNVYPKWLRTACEEITRKTQTPTDLAGMLAFAILSTCLAGKVVIEARPGWVEPCMMYVVVVLDPANRKSPVYKYMTAPIKNYQNRVRNEANTINATLVDEKDTLERQLENTKNRAAKFGLNDVGRDEVFKEVTILAEKLSEMDVPIPPTLYVDECTPEAVVPVMEENDGRIAILSDEGDAIDIMTGRYSAGSPRLSAYKKGYDAGDLLVRRMTRVNTVEGACMTIGVTTQRETLRSLGKTGKVRGEGFLGRFCYAVPEDNLGDRDDLQPEIPESVTTTYHEHINALLEIPWRDFGDGVREPYLLTWEPSAFEIFHSYGSGVIEPMLKDPAELGQMKDWAGKLVGRCARIAALLHYAENIENHPDPSKIPVSVKTAKKAIALCHQYIVPHAKVAYDMMTSDQMEDEAAKLLEEILARKYTSITAIEAWKPFKQRYQKAEDYLPVLHYLCEYNYLREIPEDDIREYCRTTGRLGRPPKHLYEVSPLWLKDHAEEAMEQTVTIEELMSGAFDEDDEDDDEEVSI